MRGHEAAHQPPELTFRAVLTGMLIGAALAPCNIYSGLKIGWAFNMSVAAGLIGFAFWQTKAHLFGGRSWGIHENNINQTSASSAASIVSSGLAAPIPAVTLLTGMSLSWQVLAVWLFAVSLVGVLVAMSLRNQMLMREKLPFPSGVATAEVLQQIHSGGRQAHERLRVLFSGIVVSGGLKLITELVISIPRLAPALSVPALSGPAVSNAARPTFANLGIALDPSLLMAGFGMIAGLKVGISALLGALLAWGILAPLALSNGWAQAGPPDPSASWFGPLVEWLLWPGVTLMVVSSLTSFAISMLRLARRRAALSLTEDAVAKHDEAAPAVSRTFFVLAFLSVLAITSAAQIFIFGIGPLEAAAAVLLSFVLAVVAARVSGETGITPVGALGKVTQLIFGVISPANPTANLMTANVTGGASDQCADLLHDLRTGQIIGTTPAAQYVAQFFGVATGSMAGALAYLLLIPDPQGMLLTSEWPAPAVATWKAVAEVLRDGISALPEGAPMAIAIAGAAGVALAVAEAVLPSRAAKVLPSPAAMGLAFVIPAWNSISLFLGAAAGALATRLIPEWAGKMLIVLAAGLVVGESLAGVTSVLVTAFSGG